MKLLDQLITLRKDIVNAIGTVNDSNGLLCWDNTRPNSSTRHVLQRLLDRHLAAGEEFGIYLVTRHCICPNPEHSNYPISEGRHGVKDWADENFVWTHEQIFEGEKTLPCACKNGVLATKHRIIEELVYRKHGATRHHQSYVNAIGHVNHAIQNSGDNKPRSAIREWLLKAVLQLNDAITPQTVDEYILARSQSGASSGAK